MKQEVEFRGRGSTSGTSGTDQKGHLSFARTALLFHENRALSFSKKGTFSPGTKSGGALAPNAPGSAASG